MSLKLRTNRLEVTLAEPGLAPNTTVRFDRAGFVTQVRLDGKHWFCGCEPHNLAHPCSGGVGLCSEFRCAQPIADASLGEKFLKPGVGLLEKIEEKFFFYLPCPTQPLPVEISKSEHGFRFDTASVPCGGYALRHTKTVDAIENRIEMQVEVENTGEKTVSFTEYCHNFLTVDGLPTGPEYTLAMPVQSQVGKPLKSGTALLGTEDGFTFSQFSAQASLTDVPGEEIDRSVPFRWALRHRGAGAGVIGQVSFAPEKAVVWACGNVISPQTHIAVQLRPGQTARWQRVWTFYD